MSGIKVKLRLRRTPAVAPEEPRRPGRPVAQIQGQRHHRPINGVTDQNQRGPSGGSSEKTFLKWLGTDAGQPPPFMAKI